MNRFKLYTTLIFTLFALLQTAVIAGETDSSAVKSAIKKNVNISGSIGVNTINYSSVGIDNPRDPFFWQVNANLNIKVGILSIPFSARFNKGGSDLSYPTLPAQIGLSPKYKDWTFHAGYRSITFSEFSLAGNQFVGGGVEYAPKNFWLTTKIVYGRFQKADLTFDENRVIIGVPTHERWGGGVQFLIKKNNTNLGLHAFKAKDDEAILLQKSDSIPLNPQDNLVYGFTLDQKVTDKLTVKGELTWSALTQNTNIENSIYDRYTYLNDLGNLLNTNSSTQLKKAAVAKATYNGGPYSINLTYRRIDPEYKSLGAVFLNNDLEDVTAGINFGLLKKKLNTALSGGFQRNNLDADKVTKTVRLIGSANIAYAPNEKWNIALNGANFTTSTSMTLVYNGPDTLRFAQVSRNAGANITRNISGDKSKQTIGLNFNYQEAITEGDKLSQNFVNALNYNINLTAAKLTGTAVMTYTRSINTAATNEMIGPTVGLAKPLLKSKMNLTYAYTYLATLINGQNQGFIMNNKVACNYNINKHNSFNLSANLVNKKVETTNSSSQEFIVNFGYQFKF